MSLAAGTKLGPYEIVALLGAGGMGEVYRARDSRLRRDVAIKVLPANFSADPGRLHRFEQEARATGALNHPNILVVYDIGEHAGAPYVVSELLEGSTLRDRLHAGPISQRKVLDYALQLARGLAAAHEKGIVHRDLKPENIFITDDGRTKILDFGLAKLIEPISGSDSPTELPTHGEATGPGIVLGTIGYMSPEQVRGRPTDHRSDIFSTGAVMYEMLSGKRAFPGDSAVESLNAILKEDPPSLSNQAKVISPGLERIVEHCLEKDPAERFQSARDLAFAVGALSGSSSADAKAASLAVPATSTRRNRLLALVAGLLALAMIGAASFTFGYYRHAPFENSVIRFALPLPERSAIVINFDENNLSISPDGSHLAFAANEQGERKLWVRPLAALDAQALPGTEGAYSPFWSPDSRYIAFFAGGKLRRIEASGTSLQTISNLSGEVNGTGTWGRDGTIVFSDISGGRVLKIYRVSALGGTPSGLTSGAQQDMWPHFLPDGKHYLGMRFDEEHPEATGIYLYSLESNPPKLLLATQVTRMEYAQGFLLFAREGSLMGQRFDERTLQLSGEPFTVVEHIPYFSQTGWSEFSVSKNGVLAYLTKRPRSRLVWLDRSGRETGQVGSPGWFGEMRLSRDDRRLAVTLSDERLISGDIWIYDLARDSSTRFAFGPTDDGTGVWSPDGRRIAYFTCCEAKASPSTASTLRIKDVGDTGKGESPLGVGFQNPMDWSPDGRVLLYTQENYAASKASIWVLPMGGASKPVELMQSPFSQRDPRFSPDGRWIAFASNETGHDEVYVTLFEQPRDKWRVSMSGGRNPSWRHDGKELFFLTADQSMMSVTIESAGQNFRSKTPVRLFRNTSILNDVFDVSADGQRFIVASSASETQTLPFGVIVNWAAEIKARQAQAAK